MPTWETSGDWDAAVEEDGVGHYALANTDYSDASIVQQAYDYTNFSEITPTPVSCWPLHEDSGTTANDLAGTNDGTYNGPMLGQTGPLGTTAPSFDGADDQITVSIPETLSTRTWVWWARAASLGETSPTYRTIFANDNEPFLVYTVGPDLWRADDDSFNRVQVSESQSAVESGWHMVAVTHDEGNGRKLRVYDESGVVGTDTLGSAGGASAASTTYFGSFGDNTRNWQGELATPFFYNTELSNSQLDTLHDVVTSPGTLTTDYRTG